MIVTNCISGTLSPYVPSGMIPWNEARARHLLNRMGYGASKAQIDQILAMTPSQAVDALMDQAVSTPPSAPPVWANWLFSDYGTEEEFFEQQAQQTIEWVTNWVSDMKQIGFKEKLTLFWHNHFVTKLEAYLCPSHMYQYHTLLQEYALGNFKDFVSNIGKEPAMLVFLNGVQNTHFEPNENYARELYELFTLGRDNGYTQIDIQETAKALTGWNGYLPENYCGEITFIDASFDPGEKTIFGRTGNWNYDDVHTILFEERAVEISQYICGKLYKHFVHPEIDDAIVNELASVFRANDWDISVILRMLFKSEHFFDDYTIGTLVKSPVDYFLSFANTGNFIYNDEVNEAVTYFIYQLGQELFNPVDVAGWPGDRSWVDGNTMTSRWQAIDYFLYYIFENAPEDFSNFVLSIAEGINDPTIVTQKILDYFLPNGMQSPEGLEQAVEVFKWEVPQNYYDDGSWNLYWDTVPAQVAFLIQFISRLPEYQLN